MPEIVKMASSGEVMPHVRDGYIMMFIFLPSAFKEDFTEFIGDIIPIILQVSQHLQYVIFVLTWVTWNFINVIIITPQFEYIIIVW